MEHLQLSAFLVAVLAAAAVVDASVLPQEVPFLPSDPSNPGSCGNTFLIAYMRNILPINLAQPYFVVSTNDNGTVEFEVNTRFGGVENTTTFTVTYNQPKRITFTAADVYITGRGDRDDKVIWVQAEAGKKISVYVINDEFRSTDGFVALPCDAMTVPNNLRYEYLILSTDQDVTDESGSRQWSSQFLIVTCEADTAVTVIPSSDISAGGDFPNPLFGPNLDTQMSNWQINGNAQIPARQFLLITKNDDLTGTIIQSTKPLVVISGHQCGQVPDTETACDFIASQVPPQTTWGYTFLLNPLDARFSGDLYRFGVRTSPSNINRIVNTEVTITCVEKGSSTARVEYQMTLNSTQTENWGQFETGRGNNISSFVPKFCCLQATNPVLVAQYSYGYSVDMGLKSDGQLGDPFMSIIPPIIQYKRFYPLVPITLVTGSITVRRVGVSVYVDYFQPNRIMLDDAPFEADRSQWQAIYCPTMPSEICGYAITKELDDRPRVLYYAGEGGAIFVQSYGFLNQNSYGLSGGMELQPIAGSTVACAIPDECVTEGTQVMVVCTRSGDRTAQTRILIGSEDGTAMAGADYDRVDFAGIGANNLPRNTINYRGGNRQTVSQSFPVTIRADSDDTEPPETFFIAVSPVRTAVVLTLRITVTICGVGGCPALPDISNGGVTWTGLNPGNTSTYTCDSGFILDGSATRMCRNNGTWSGDEPTCQPVMCPELPNIADGGVTWTGLTVGSEATYTCDSGFVLDGSATRMCRNDGTWSGDEPTCRRQVMCPALPDISNGGVTWTGLTAGETATYTCDAGFILVGSATRTCGNNGTWSGDEPTCQPVMCPELPNIADDGVTWTGLTVGSEATYTCDSEFILDGSATRTCTNDGTWSGDEPTCRPVMCPELPSITNGGVTWTGLTVGSEATYTCNSGFELVGSPTRMCGGGGTWSGEEPMCDPTCDDGALRLRNGSTVREGRVELCLNGIWGTVCDDNWNNEAAAVVCRQLGFSEFGATAAQGGVFPSGVGSILLDEVDCVGTERNLTECNYLDRHDCRHFEDAGVICEENGFSCDEGDVRLSGGQTPYEGRVEYCLDNRFGIVCDDGQWDDADAQVVCNQLGYGEYEGSAIAIEGGNYGTGVGPIHLTGLVCTGNEFSLANCTIVTTFFSLFCSRAFSAGVLCPTPNRTCDNGDVRLINGRLSSEGRVEVCYNNHWGTVCHDGWGVPEATVVCREIGFDSNGSIPVVFSDFGPGEGVILLANLLCTGEEENLAECPHSGIASHRCNHGEDAGVVCEDAANACEEGAVRLVGGKTSYAGRLEICFLGHWGTVCDDLFGNLDASIVCRQLGLEPEGAIAQPRALFGRGVGLIFLDDTDCIGNETRLEQCSHLGIGTSNCFHSEDVSILCNNANVTGGCKNGEIRLVGGHGSYSGRVEVCFNNIWGSVCDDGWGKDDAEVVCQQLGFDPKGSIGLGNAYFGEGSGPIFLDDVSCNLDNHTSLIDCVLGVEQEIGEHNCQHSEDASVICPIECDSGSGSDSDQPTEPGYCNCTNGDVRLVGGQLETEGRLEVCINGFWGTICNNFWSNLDAVVVCRQLGFAPTDATAFDSDEYGEGTGHIFLDSFLCNGEENALLDCFHRRVTEGTCSHMQDVGVKCSAYVCVDGDVRLAGGQYPSEGRVEVCFDEQYGTVCDSLFDALDAAVVCRQLGYNDGEGAIALLDSFFGLGTRGVAIDLLDCNGNETRVSECSHERNPFFCFDDAAVLCQSSDVNCTNGDLRLAGSSDPHEGRVEVCFNGNWGSVCQNGWTNIDAITVCSILNYTENDYAISTSGRHFGPAPGPIFLDNVNCTGDEDNILDCLGQDPGLHQCRHSQDIGVICPVSNSSFECQSGEVRLMDGTSRYEGRVELCINGEWGTVCDDFWDNRDAAVVCSQLGFGRNATAQQRAFFGEGQGLILLDNVQCVGTEKHLMECPSIGVGSFCFHFEDAGVKCGEPACRDGEVRLFGGSQPSEGTIEICQNERWGTVCDDFWDSVDAGVVCRQLGFESEGALALRGAHFGRGTSPILLDDVSCLGNESSLLECAYDDTPFCFHFEDAGVVCPDNVTANCTNGDVRLVDSRSAYQGRVEVCLHGRWGSVCDDQWDSRDAQVVCNQLGLTGNGQPYGGGGNQFGGGNSLIFLDDVDCDGTEDTLLECRGLDPGTHNCDASENAGVYCPKPNATCDNGDVRLMGGSTEFEGRVEVCLDENWGTVCADFFWSDNAAEVICRQLGLPWESAIAVGDSVFGLGTGSILLTGLRCNGTEDNILNCPTSFFFFIPFFCQDHSSDAGVVCYANTSCADGDVRLVGGAVPNEGRVELCFNDHWGTVCDDLWDNNDAAVVCRQLGYPPEGGLALSRSFFGSGFGRIHLDDLRCDGTEDAIINCTHRGELNHNCGHIEDAGIICVHEGDNRCEHGALRLRSVGQNVEEQLEGTLEVCFGGNWGTICDDLWDVNDASVACRQLGFSDIGAIAHPRARFGQGDGPIFMDDLRCFGNETRIEQCRSSGLAVHNCRHSEDAGVTCRPIPCVDGTVRVIDGYGPLNGRLEICNNEEWGTVCGTGFTDEMAAIACAAMNNSREGAIRSAEGLFEQSPRSRSIYTLTICDESSDCVFNTTLASSCTHDNDVGVFCRGETFSVCETGLIRLFGALGGTEGRLEVCVDDQWGTVCDDSWDKRGADLVCRLLDYPGYGETVSPEDYGDASMFPILLDDVKCTGSESNILSCPQLALNTSHDCIHDEDVAIVCQGAPLCQDGDIQLVNGEFPTEGTIQICLDSQWGTVCDDFFDHAEARVVCRKLGLTNGPTIPLRGAHFGEGTGDILLDNLFCTGNESSLLDCPYSPHNCRHFEDAGVICPNTVDNGANCTTGELRLVGGASEYQGRVEVCIHGRWGTVCDDFWDNRDAQVVCNQLGYTSDGFAHSVSNAAFGRGAGLIFLDNVECEGYEEELLACRSQEPGSHNCGSSEDAGVYCPDPTAACTNGMIRLADGTNRYEGRVEMCVGGEWGTICGDSFWGDEDATVVCRQLGFNERFAVGVGFPAAFGPGEGRVLFQLVRCNGSETELIGCPYASVGPFSFRCSTHTRDASVVCQNPNATCTEGDVRLMGGATDNEGRVEICLRNHWGTLCDNGWDMNDAMVVCRQLNYSTNGVIAKNAGFFGQGFGRVHLDNLNCTGSESRLGDCQYSSFQEVTCRSFEDDVGVLCPLTFNAECTHGDVRLRDGRTPLDGRVEVCVGGRWGTVCDDFWDDRDAGVVCRQLGHSFIGADARFDVTPGRENVSIFLDDVLCSGVEASLFDCPSLPVGSHNCRHFEDAGVFCQPLPCTPGSIRLMGGVTPRNGRVEICVNERWGTVCDQGFTDVDASMVCARANFTGDSAIGNLGFFGSGAIGPIYASFSGSSRPAPPSCTHASDMVVFCTEEVYTVCKTGSLRLIGSGSTSEGRLQICIGNRWGTVCDDSWHVMSSILTCDLLGKVGGDLISPNNFNASDFPIFLDDVKCTGSESNLLSCPQLPFSISHDCTHQEDVALQCLDMAECTDGEVRLVGASNKGRVELCKYGQWASVCADNQWDDTDAATVCRQLNLPGGKVIGDTGFGEGSGSLVFSQFMCNSSNDKLKDCPFNVISRDRCPNDAEISCIDPSMICTDGDIRLVGGATNSIGRVELCSDNQWNSICSETWDESEATVVCRQLRYSTDGARATPEGFFDGGDLAPPTSDAINCQRDEQRLDNCNIERNTTCNGVAGVFCQAVEAQCTYGDLRLIDGKNEREGRLQVCIGGLWGSVCDSSSQWGATESAVVCRKLGFSEDGAEVGSDQYTGVGSGPVFLDSTMCLGSEATVMDCNVSAAIASCSNHQQDVGIACQDTSICTDGDIRLVGGATNSIGRVELCSDNQWNSICSETWDESEATVVCRQLQYSTDGARATPEGFFDGGNIAPPTSDAINCQRDEQRLDNCEKDRNTTCNGMAGVFCQAVKAQCTYGDLRLIDGKNEREGRLQVCIGGLWGSVCDSSSQWGATESAVVCRKLGFREDGAEVGSDQYTGVGSGPVFLDSTMCLGSEATVMDCNVSAAIASCSNHQQDVGISCQEMRCAEGEVRLAGGSSVYGGRVEVCISAEWGTVCAAGVGQSDAQSICTKPGISGDGAILTGGGFFGKGSGTIYGSLNGSGSTDSCTHDNDVGVICSDRNSTGACATGDVRLSGAADSSKGRRVEVCYDGQWGTVCNDNWDNDDAKVVCGQLKKDTEEATAQTVGGGSGDILLTNIKCSGNEAHILSCPQSPFGTINHCSHDEDAGVICTNVKVTKPEPSSTGTPRKTSDNISSSSSNNNNTASIVVPIILIILLIILVIVAIVLGVLYYRKRKTGKTIFTVRSQPDQLPFAESSSFPEGLAAAAGEPEKTETL